MNYREEMHLLSFDNISHLIDLGLSQLPQHLQLWIKKDEYVLYMLEWLSVKISDHEATSAIDLAVAYLKRFDVPEQFARDMSRQVMDEVINTVLATFPLMSFQELAECRYVRESDNTLQVFVKRSMNEENRY